MRMRMRMRMRIRMYDDLVVYGANELVERLDTGAPRVVYVSNNRDAALLVICDQCGGVVVCRSARGCWGMLGDAGGCWGMLGCWSAELRECGFYSDSDKVFGG